MNNITMTRANNTVTIKVWNNDTKAVEMKKATFAGTLNAATVKAIRNDCENNDTMLLKVYEDTITTGALIKYSMPEDLFYTIAEKMEKRPQGDYISRSATVYGYAVTLYNRYTDDIEDGYKYTTANTPEKAKKAIQKEYKNTDKIVLNVKLEYTKTDLFVMAVSKFIELASVVE